MFAMVISTKWAEGEQKNISPEIVLGQEHSGNYLV